MKDHNLPIKDHEELHISELGSCMQAPDVEKQAQVQFGKPTAPFTSDAVATDLANMVIVEVEDDDNSN